MPNALSDRGAMRSDRRVPGTDRRGTRSIGLGMQVPLAPSPGSRYRPRPPEPERRRAGRV